MPSKEIQLPQLMTPLPCGFSPGCSDVICARGSTPRNHIGNRRYKALIKRMTSAYAKADSRHAKSAIVTKIVYEIRSKAGTKGGGFVKCVNGIWCEVSDQIAREKIGQSFRDSLHGLYRSSTKNKRKRRTTAGAGIANAVEELFQSNEVVTSRLNQLSEDYKDAARMRPTSL